MRRIPLLASARGGVAAPLTKCGEATLTGRRRGGVPFCFQSENHPGLAKTMEASRHLMDRSATPPCCSARRGVASLKHSTIFFTAHMTARLLVFTSPVACLHQGHRSGPAPVPDQPFVAHAEAADSCWSSKTHSE